MNINPVIPGGYPNSYPPGRNLKRIGIESKRKEKQKNILFYFILMLEVKWEIHF
jgi:hypothetical protein